MAADVVVLGAGIIGVSVALQLARRGKSVVLLDRRGPGEETSFGNAGLIQREGVVPYGFPQDLALLLRYSLNNRIDVRYRLSALPKIAPFLGRYWYNSAAIRHAAIARAYSPLIEHSVSEHNILIDEAKAADLIVKNGWMEAYRTAERRDADYAFAERLSREHGISHTKLDAEELATAEPHLSRNFAGGLKWNDPWSVRDPHALTLAYVKLFESLGGTLCPGRCLHPQPDDKRLDSAYRDGGGGGRAGRCGTWPLGGRGDGKAGLSLPAWRQARLSYALCAAGRHKA